MTLIVAPGAAEKPHCHGYNNRSMCLLAIHYRTVSDAPLLVAANREEFFNRPFLPPHVQGDATPFLAGVDVRAGGTWLGINARGVLVAVTNRAKSALPVAPRSRGLLCRDMLEVPSAVEAADLATRALAAGHYAGANFVAADAQTAFVIEAGDEPRQTSLPPGLHLVTNGPPNDPGDARQQFARELFAAGGVHDVASFLAVAARVCGHGPDPATGRTIVLRGADRGTVCSTLVAITTDVQKAVYQFAPSAPDVTLYTDLSRELRSLLGGAAG
ncbi:MAG: NRDE family protein [Planctomycetia bacterium]|nr:NRDE family protein [Planctomycetia bacterium]